GSSTQFSGGDPNGYPVRISYASVAVSGLAFYAALDQGLFQQQHIKVTMIMMASNVAITALAQGETDFADSPGTAVEGASKGLPMRVVLSSWQRSPWTIMGKPELKSMQDLKGKTVGTGVIGTSTYLY